MALPKVHRLRRQDFSAIYQTGLRRNSSHLTLRALKAPEPVEALKHDRLLLPPQLGVSVSQKVSKKAVLRNRIRRRLQAAFQQLLPLVSPGWRMVVVVRPSAIECEYEQFLQELKQLLVEAEVINGH